LGIKAIKSFTETGGLAIGKPPEKRGHVTLFFPAKGGKKAEALGEAVKALEEAVESFTEQVKSPAPAA
jgi:hypothetical protein